MIFFCGVSIAEVEAMTPRRLDYWHGRAFRTYEAKQAAIGGWVSQQRLLGGR